ncbi:hypothetical protein EMCRGX_G033989 [Ephydatia muelleri]|eukprot:Em0022g250a
MATCSDDEYEIETEHKCGGCDDHGCDGQKEDQAFQNMVKLCKDGNLSEIKKILERDGMESLQQFDSEGHTLVHWASLAGHLDMVMFLVDSGAPINEHSRNDYGPCPIHWGCVNGHIGIIGFFVDRGVPIDMTDMNGCTPLIIAAQYGQSLAISYLLQKGANRFHTDVNGDGALHWAAFKGNPEAVFILLNAGLNPKQKDAFGQTPLHSACIKGDIQCAEMLIEQGAITEDADSNNKTPKMLATGRRHREVVKLLDKKEASVDFWDWRTYVFGPPGRSRSAALFFVCTTLFWSYPYYFMVVVPLTLEEYWNTHLGFWIISILMWVMFAWSKFSDPGYIAPNQGAYDQAVKLIGNPAAWTDYQDLYNPIYNMCHTCKTVRPPRSKHCRQCNKCVHEFDHHCPWIDNCVGKKNRVPFTIFLIVLTGTGLFGAFFLYKVFELQGCDFFWYLGAVFFGFATIQVLWMLETQVVTMVKNMTINERSNKTRYRHFKAPDGKFRNPFSRGLVRNCLEFWNIAEPSHYRRSVSAV